MITIRNVPDLGLYTSLDSLSMGETFEFESARGRLYYKVKPTGFLCNSNILNDVFARGDCLVVSLHQPATVCCMDGKRAVIKKKVSLEIIAS